MSEDCLYLNVFVPPPRVFAVGEKIEAQFMGRGTYYAGTVTAVNDDASLYSIRYDDGDTSRNVPAAQVRAPGSSSSSLPVMVWIHGGGFATGGGNKASFNGIYLPALTKDLIVVTLNYRLNIFGFLGAREITDPGYGTGNWGILDQRAAMQWVHTHISGVSSHRRS